MAKPYALIFGRYLDINEIEKVVRADRLSLTVYGINEVQMPPDFQAAFLFVSERTNSGSPIEQTDHCWLHSAERHL